MVSSRMGMLLGFAAFALVVALIGVDIAMSIERQSEARDRQAVIFRRQEVIMHDLAAIRETSRQNHEAWVTYRPVIEVQTIMMKEILENTKKESAK